MGFMTAAAAVQDRLAFGTVLACEMYTVSSGRLVLLACGKYSFSRQVYLWCVCVCGAAGHSTVQGVSANAPHSHIHQVTSSSWLRKTWPLRT